MPEVLTKYPDTVLQVLSGGGAKCGAGAPQRILKSCPAARFCATSNGELCVYGIDEIASMTQVTSADLASRVCGQRAGLTGAFGQEAAVVTLFVFVAGLGLARWHRRRARHGLSS